MLLFDSLLTGSATYFDDLNDAPGIGYVQTASVVVTFSGDGGQETVATYEQPLDVVFNLYGGGAQEYLAPGQAAGYLQSANGSVVLFGDGLQEYVAVIAGIWTQTGTGALDIASDALQVHLGGANAGEVLQQADAIAVFTPLGAQQWFPPGSLVSVTFTQPGVGSYRGSAGTFAFNLVGALLTVNRVSFEFSSINGFFVTNVGPKGGAVFVELALVRNGQRTPLVSVSSANPQVHFIADADPQQRFTALRDALLGGAFEIEVGGYERLDNRVVPLSLPGTAALTVAVVP